MGCTGFTAAEGAGIADNAATFGKGDFLFITNMQNGPGTAGTISGFNMICGGIWNTVNDGTGAGATGGIAHTTICSFDTPFRVGVHFDSDDIFGRGPWVMSTITPRTGHPETVSQDSVTLDSNLPTGKILAEVHIGNGIYFCY